MKKKRSLILLLLFIISITGCSTQKDKPVENGEYAIIKSSMKYGDRTEITYFDTQMNEVDIKKYKYGNVGEFQYHYPIVKGDTLYEISLGYGDDKDNCKILAINLKTDEVKEYKSSRVNITDICVDDKYIYAISNLNKVTYIDRYLIDGDDMQSIELKDIISVDMFVWDGKVYFYKEEDRKNVSNIKRVLNRIDFSTKKIENFLSDKIKFEEESSFYVIYNDQIYIPYGKDIVALSPNTLNFKVIKMPKSENEVCGFYQDGSSLYVAQADLFGENNNVSIIKYDLEKKEIVNKYKASSTLMQFSVKKEELYILSFEDELIKYSMKENGELKELKRVQLDTEGYQFVSAGFICNNQ